MDGVIDFAVRRDDWPHGFQARIGDAWRRCRGFTGGWSRVVHGQGQADVERVYRELLDGRVSSADGHVLSLRHRSR